VKTTYKLDGTNTIPNTLANTFSNSGPFQGSAQGVAFTAGENQSISGLRFLKMYDADGVEVSRIQYGFSTTGQTTTRTIPIEPASVVQVMTAGAYDTNAALSIGVTSSTSSGLAIIQNFADVEVANNFSYVTTSLDISSPKTSSITSGVAVDVGAGYVRFYDAGTGNDIFVMCTMQPSGAVTSDTLPYSHDSAIQGHNLSPTRNGSFATIALNQSKTATTVNTANVYQLNFVNAAGTMGSNTYWIDQAGYDSPSLKVGSNANGNYVQFKSDGEVIAVLQFGTHGAGLSTFTQNLPVSMDTDTFAINCVGPFGQRYSTVSYARTVSSFTARNYNGGGGSSASCDWSTWWVKI